MKEGFEVAKEEERWLALKCRLGSAKDEDRHSSPLFISKEGAVTVPRRRDRGSVQRRDRARGAAWPDSL